MFIVRKNKLNIISIINIIINILFLTLILQLNILPTKYLIILVGVMLIINILGILFINLNKKLLKVLGSIICIFSILISLIGSYYLSLSIIA